MPKLGKRRKMAPLMPRCKATTQVTVYKGVGGKQCKRRSKPGIARHLCYQHWDMYKAKLRERSRNL